MFVSKAKYLSCVYLCGVYRCTTVAVQWNIYVQCGNHIYLVINVKYMFSAHYHMVDCSDFIWGPNFCTHLPYKSIGYLAYMAHMPNVVGIFVSSTYFAITVEVFIADGCVLVHMCKNIGPIRVIYIYLYI